MAWYIRGWGGVYELVLPTQLNGKDLVFRETKSSSRASVRFIVVITKPKRRNKLSDRLLDIPGS
jgi:hypothetical protein